MTRQDIAARVARDADITVKHAGQAVDEVIAQIRDGLVSDGKVVLKGFGNFEVRHKNARAGRNPKTGEPVTISARRVVRFKPGKDFKERVNV